jgi:hypothetical protein
LPADAGLTEYLSYSDDACSTPILFNLETPADYVAHVSRDFCVRESFADRVHAVFESAGSYDGPVYETTDEGDCVQISAGGEADYYSLNSADDVFATLVETQSD